MDSNRELANESIGHEQKPVFKGRNLDDIKDILFTSEKHSNCFDGKAKESSWDRSWFIGKFFALYTWPLFGICRESSLRDEHLDSPPSADEAHVLWRRFHSKYNGSFMKTLLKLYKWRLASLCLIQMISGCALNVFLGITLGKLVRDIGAQEQDYSLILQDMFILFGLMWLNFLVTNWTCLESFHLGTKFRVGASRMIYTKSLRLSQDALSQATSGGQIVNLLTNDLSRLDQFAYKLAHLIRAPCQVIVTLYILNVKVGFYPTLAGLATIGCLLILNGTVARFQAKFRSKTAQETDKRVGLIEEILASIRTLKMYAWEEPLANQVNEVRDRELHFIGVKAFLKAISNTIFLSSVRVIAFFIYITLILLGNSLEPDVLFISFGLITSMSYAITWDFQLAIVGIAEALVSCARIDSFLASDEKQQYQSNCLPQQDYAIKLTNVSCSWPTHTKQTPNLEKNIACKGTRVKILDNLNFSLKSDERLLVIGRVGSGKTSLLLALLRELSLDSGCIDLSGRVSYAPQAAWLFAGTIRENILLAEDYDRKRYQEVVGACSLVRDFEALPRGDMSLVGEQGVSLSGGQKARVNLARALYRQADVYLLDDPLSAVDSSVASHIFEKAICSFLAHKLVVLATHQIQYLHQGNHKILILDRRNESCSEKAQFGTYKELSDSGALAKLDLEKDKENEKQQETCADGEKASYALAASPAVAQHNLTHQDSTETQQKLAKMTIQTTNQLSNYEQDEQASIENFQTWAAVKFYARHMFGWKGLVLMILINTLGRFMLEYNLVFLSMWADSSHRRSLIHDDETFECVSWLDYLTRDELIGIYALISFGIILTVFLHTAQFYWFALKASRKLHQNLFKSLLNAPISFYDFRPIGAVLNRITRDVGYLDELLPETLINIICIGYQILGTMTLICIVDHSNLIPCGAFLIAMLLLRRLIISAIIQLRHLEARARSPILSHISTTLLGLPTIRAFSAQGTFLNQFDEYQNVHTSAWFTNITAGCLAADLLNFLVLSFICFVIGFKICVTLDSSNAATIGLVIIRLLCLPESVDWAFRQVVEIEAQLTSVQRVADYAHLRPESSTTSGTPTQHDASKCASSIQFKQVKMRYSAQSEPILKDISLSIGAGERVGVVGRTGAGKSSIIAALFRMYPFEGSIEIGGQDTNSIQLAALRSAISIIPQDPVLFGGSLRHNLDPFGEYDDLALWQALDAVKLKQTFYATSAGLNFELQSSGSNLSLGQRQLLCLARAILKRNEILVLDEATANVDSETDQFIQTTIRSHFKNCTILTIAHRLLTIIDSDRVLVMEDGFVREYDAPAKLASRSDSYFNKLINSSDTQLAKKLRSCLL